MAYHLLAPIRYDSARTRVIPSVCAKYPEKAAVSAQKRASQPFASSADVQPVTYFSSVHLPECFPLRK